MSILTLGSKKEEKGNFQSKKKRRKVSNQRKKGRIGNWFFKKTSDFDSLRHVTQDVGGAKESLQKVTGQEDTPRSMVEDLRMELEKVKRGHSELKEKESKIESIVENVQVQLWKSEFEQKGYLTGKSKARGALEEMILTLKQLFSLLKKQGGKYNI